MNQNQVASKQTNVQPQGRKHCPCCMATVERWRPIVYGPVAASVLKQAKRGEVILGGLNHGRNEPVWHCTRCESRFGRPREELDRFGRALPSARTTDSVTRVPMWRLMKTVRLSAVAARNAA